MTLSDTYIDDLFYTGIYLNGNRMQGLGWESQALPAELECPPDILVDRSRDRSWVDWRSEAPSSGSIFSVNMEVRSGW